MSEETGRVIDVVEWYRQASNLTRRQPPTATRRLQFCAGHRVFGHETKCAHPHGHNYVAFVKASGPLDDIGRVIDFSVIKTLVGDWIENNWDHGFLYFENDLEMCDLFGRFPQWRAYACPFNPTAENMAEYLLRYVAPKLFAGTGVTVVEVVLEETENCQATARL